MSDKRTANQENGQNLKETEIICENCHATTTGSYCSQCGQPVESTLKYFWNVILHILDDVFSFDSRASRTLWPLLIRPAFLTNEYIAGRRVHYVPPLRLYLFISIIFFIALKFFAGSESGGFINLNAGSSLKQVEQQISILEQSKKTAGPAVLANIDIELARFRQYQESLSTNQNTAIKAMTTELVDLEMLRINNRAPLNEKDQKRYNQITKHLEQTKNGEPLEFLENGFSIGNNKDGSFTIDYLSKENNEKLTKYIDALEEKAARAFQSDATPLIKEAIGKLPQLMFILLPIFALLLKVMYLFSKRLYLEHLTVALHSHSFIFLMILLLELLDYFQSAIRDSSPSIADYIGTFSVFLFTWIPIYLFIMQKRIYRQGYLLTAAKFGLTGISYLILIALTGVIAFIWGLADS
ncbi:DUF3667 domain-containing protein [Colwelliaceae bacterium 6471]